MTNLQKIKDACVKANPSKKWRYTCDHCQCGSVIELTPRLADVLWMFNKNIEGKTDFYYEIDTAGNFIKRKRSFDEHGAVSTFPRWNLLDDNLDHQPEEVINFIAELL